MPFLLGDAVLRTNTFKGTLGNPVSALLSAAAMNFGKLLKWVRRFWLFFSELLKTIFPTLPAPLQRSVHFFSIDCLRIDMPETLDVMQRKDT